jgi:hypothetical protein
MRTVSVAISRQSLGMPSKMANVNETLNAIELSAHAKRQVFVTIGLQESLHY